MRAEGLSHFRPVELMKQDDGAAAGGEPLTREEVERTRAFVGDKATPFVEQNKQYIIPLKLRRAPIIVRDILEGEIAQNPRFLAGLSRDISDRRVVKGDVRAPAGGRSQRIYNEDSFLAYSAIMQTYADVIEGDEELRKAVKEKPEKYTDALHVTVIKYPVNEMARRVKEALAAAGLEKLAEKIDPDAVKSRMNENGNEDEEDENKKRGRVETVGFAIPEAPRIKAIAEIILKKKPETWKALVGWTSTRIGRAQRAWETFGATMGTEQVSTRKLREALLNTGLDVDEGQVSEVAQQMLFVLAFKESGNGTTNARLSEIYADPTFSTILRASKLTLKTLQDYEEKIMRQQGKRPELSIANVTPVLAKHALSQAK